jgi:hypothetical protein
VNHADVISNEGKISDSHLLIDEASGIGSDEYRTYKVSGQESRERLMMHSVALIVVNAPIPNNSPSALHHSIK